MGDHLDYCKPPALVEIKANDPCPSTLWTWAPERAEWVYLIKIMGFTLLYVPSSDTVYFVNPAYALRNSCPANTVMVAQCVRDEGYAPRLLVVDLLCERSVRVQDTDPAARYRRLQDLQQHFVEPNCVLQWCGERDALGPSFMDSLPHRVAARVGLGEVGGNMVIEKMI